MNTTFLGRIRTIFSGIYSDCNGSIRLLVAMGILGLICGVPTRLLADEPKKVMTRSVSAIGQYIWTEERVSATIMNQPLSKEYSFSGMRAGIEGSLMWSLSKRLTIHARLGLTMDKLPKMTSNECGLCSSVQSDECDKLDPSDAVCDATFESPMTLGISPAFALAFFATPWIWFEAGMISFFGLANNREPDMALHPTLGVGFDFFHKKERGLYLRCNAALDVLAGLPTGLSPVLALGMRF